MIGPLSCTPRDGPAGVPSALLEELKAAAREAGLSRLALVGGVVRDWLLHSSPRSPGQGSRSGLGGGRRGGPALAAVLQRRCGSQRVTGVQQHGAFATVALQLDGCCLIRRRAPGALSRAARQPGGSAGSARAGSGAARLHHQRDGAGSARGADRSSWRPGRTFRPAVWCSCTRAALLTIPPCVIRAARYGARLG